jgi:hypothetical protein
VAVGQEGQTSSGRCGAAYRGANFLAIATSAVSDNLDVVLDVKNVLDRLLAADTEYDELRPDQAWPGRAGQPFITTNGSGGPWRWCPIADVLGFLTARRIGARRVCVKHGRRAWTV